MSRVLVTGGAGFIGSHLCDALLAAGHEVHALDDLSTGLRANLGPAAAFHEVDVCDEAIESVFASVKPEIVFHLAAQMCVSRSTQAPMLDGRINILGSINVLEACRKHGVGKFIFASTGGAGYGNPAELPATENCPPQPVSHYGVAKMAVEKYVHLYHTLYGLPYTLLRYANVYGPRQNPHGEAGVCSIFVDKLLAGEAPTLYGDGAPVRDYVHVLDVVRATMLAMDKGAGETLNIGSGVGTTVRELYDRLKVLTGFDGEPVLKPLRDGEVACVYLSAEKAARVLGWRPEIALADGLADLCAYMAKA